MIATGTLFFRVIARKLRASGGTVQFILLGGFEATLTTAKASYFETLSPGRLLEQSEIDDKVAAMKKHSNAATARDVTDDGVAKKLDKLFEWDSAWAADLGVGKTFAQMGIGTYL